jgi:TatD DNase family protein
MAFLKNKFGDKKTKIKVMFRKGGIDKFFGRHITKLYHNKMLKLAMIDTHAHLEKIVPSDLGKLKYIVLAGSERSDSIKNLELAKKDKRIIPAVGVHPQSPLEDIDDLVKEARAIGECGLDYSRGVDKKQIKFFKKQIELAQKYKLPLIIHARKAVDEVIKILGEYKNIKGVFHCYAGGKKRIKKVKELGENWYFGIDGNLTYELGLEEVVMNIPKDRLVLETDCPWLTPIPHRREKNKPKYIKYIYQKVADIWKMSLKETEKIIDTNAKNLFDIR